MSTTASSAEELLVGLNGIYEMSVLVGTFGEGPTLLIDPLASNVLLVLSEAAQDAGEDSRVARTSCVLSRVMSSAAQVIVVSSSITSASTIT